MSSRFGTELELKVYDHLRRRHVSFRFETQLSGGFKDELGDPKASFVILPRIVFRILDSSNREPQAVEVVQRIAIENKGYQVVDLWVDDLHMRFNKVMEKAIKGEEFNG